MFDPREALRSSGPYPCGVFDVFSNKHTFLAALIRDEIVSLVDGGVANDREDHHRVRLAGKAFRLCQLGEFLLNPNEERGHNGVGENARNCEHKYPLASKWRGA